MRTCLILLSLLCAAALHAADSPAVITGTLSAPASGPAVLKTSSGDVVIDADKDSNAVLHDKRIAGAQIEAHGHSVAPGHFQLAEFSSKPLFIIKDGKKREVTYWCDVCSIRTYTPGKCMCCQQETALDLRDPN